MRSPKVVTVKVCVFCLVFNFLLTGCNIGPAIRGVGEILDEAIGKLESQSIGWQKVLEDTRDELIDNAHTTVSNEVSKMLSRAISDVGVEARCYTDFLRDRVKEDLIRLRAKYTKEKVSLVPVFCLPNPPTVDFALVQEGRLNTIIIDGYNLDIANIRVYLVDNQNRRDVSFALGDPSQYLITLNLGGNGVPLSSQSNKIVFKFPSNEERSINVIQPIAQEKSYTFIPPSSKKRCPTEVGGNKDFSGNGPDVSASAVLFIKNERELWVRISLHVKETKSDWTEAKGMWELPLWSAPMLSKITGYAPTTPSTADYRDVNHQLDRPSVKGSGLVQRFEINGDTDGNDIGNCTDDDVYIEVFFGEIQVKYVKK